MSWEITVVSISRPLRVKRYENYLSRMLGAKYAPRYETYFTPPLDSRLLN